MDEMHHDKQDLAEVARLLREERPQAGPDVLERARLRARSEAGRRNDRQVRTRQKGDFMRSRIAITAVLVLGMLMTATSAGLAVSSIAGDDSAGTAQYPETQVAPDQGSGVDDPAETLGEQAAGDDDDTQAARQGSTDGSSLPFTGFAALGLLAGGVGLLGSGFVLRRQARE